MTQIYILSGVLQKCSDTDGAGCKNHLFFVHKSNSVIFRIMSMFRIYSETVSDVCVIAHL